MKDFRTFRFGNKMNENNFMNPDPHLIQKYNVSGPRYTSYPTAVQFEEVREASVGGEMIREHRGSENLSLYFHIPFCFSLCWFCGCTKIITKDADRGDVYLDYLEKEIDLIRPHLLNAASNVIQIHFGGGTPTFLSPGQLKRLGVLIQTHFDIDEDVEYSVEIDPRRCSEDQIRMLREIGCNRASLGIQDIHPEVQKAIHRVQPFEQVVQVTEWLRSTGFEGVNFDLIYGLPKQTPATFRQTIHEVTQLNPDRLAVYSYAHIPDLMPAQKLLNEDEFPSTEEKLEMLTYSIEALPSYGYRFIGMDHFAKEEDELTRALDNGTLQRNFQGYSTRPGADMIAFGMSGISQVGDVYFQNSKDLSDYYRYLDQNLLPVVKMLKLNRDDRIRRDLIMKIMCQTDLNFQDFSEKWGIDFETYFRQENHQLIQLEEDGLVYRSGQGLQTTEKGRLFLRNIAMVFDAYFQSPGQKKRYSKTV
ncbi:MAG: oxygen-independent coproporphyrinogen III oxidase [Balneolaceae bacterium]